jgi:hypothetical protein
MPRLRWSASCQPSNSEGLAPRSARGGFFDFEMIGAVLKKVGFSAIDWRKMGGGGSIPSPYPQGLRINRYVM